MYPEIPGTCKLITGLPGTGKTFGLIKYIKRNSKKENPLKIAVFSNNHDHLSEIEKKVPEFIYSHLKGFSKLCRRYKDDPVVRQKYETYGNPKTHICELCGESSGCQYLHQFKFLLDDEDEDVTRLAELCKKLPDIDVPALLEHSKELVNDLCRANALRQG